MIIDVISYTDEQFASLSVEQLEQVREAQMKKNKLTAKLEKEKAEEKFRLVEQGIFLSSIWRLYCEKLQAEYDLEVEHIRESLLFYLRFSTKDEEQDKTAPYSVNYALTVEERFAIVRQYYETTYQDAKARYNAFLADPIAKTYLGELYAPLHDYFYRWANE